MHVIPPLDSPYAWDQPNRFEILVGDDTALMTQQTWDKLKEYSRSMPTGVYPGKMWKSIDESGQSYLCWYGLVPHDPRICSNNWRKIVIGDWQSLYGVYQKKPQDPATATALRNAPVLRHQGKEAG